jgi:DNA-binding transcriptional regulator LsrR (DeoR family)
MTGPRVSTHCFIADYQYLCSYGLSRRQIAERLGMTRAAVDTAYNHAVRAKLLTPDRRTA